jgi:hypothetical protein
MNPGECAVCLESGVMLEMCQNVRGRNGPVINPQTKDRSANNKKKKQSKKRASSACDEVKDRDKKAKHVSEEKAVDAIEVVRSSDDECDGDDEFKLDAAAAAAEEAAEDEDEGAFKGKDKTALTADYVVRGLDQETRVDEHGSPTTVNWHGVTLSTSPEEIFVCTNPEKTVS